MAGHGARVWGAVLVLVFAAGCASTVPLTVFQPRDSADIRSFFRNGSAIAAIYGDSAFALVQIEPVIMGVPYARLWLLVENRSSKSLLLEPLKCATLQIVSLETRTRTVRPAKTLNLTPASPTAILAMISNAKAAASIIGSIGAVLEAAAQHPTSATTSGTTTGPAGTSYTTSTTTLNDADEKRQTVLDRRASHVASIDSWYESFKNSVNQGILRRNTLFPSESVNGFIYFEVLEPQAVSKSRQYVLTLWIPGFEKVITFDPIEGE